MGLFLAISYGLPLLGGFIGNNYINFKTFLVYGLTIQACGLFLLGVIETSYLLLPTILGMVLIGCLVTSVGLLEFFSQYSGSKVINQRKAMLLYYLSMNIGNAIGSVISGLFMIGNHLDYLFILLTLMPIICIFIVSKYVQYDKIPKKETKKPFLFFSIIILILLFLINILFSIKYNITQNTLILLCIVLFTILCYYVFLFKGKERVNLISFTLYAIYSILFWSVFLLTPIIIMFLISDWVNLNWYITIQPQWLDIIDPLIIILMSPLLVYFFNALKNKFSIILPTYLLFFIAIILTAIATFLLSTYIQPEHKISPLVIILYISILALAELFIGPEGYSLPVKLSPPSIRGTITGIWVSGMCVSSLISSLIAKYILNSGHGIHKLEVYKNTFSTISLTTIILGVLLLILGISLAKINKFKPN